ncbi:MAG: ribosome-associated translation inhibitor RaiA [Bacteroidetes bacterium]|nr:ribosome-associated translation inhibitor RaiA [Bacteroidota bacterium]
MKIQITARHFKIHPQLHDSIIDKVGNLIHFYEGVIKVDVVLSFERVYNCLKTVELLLHIYDKTLTIVEKSDDYLKSLDFAVKRMERLLIKIKEKKYHKHKKQKEVIGITV